MSQREVERLKKIERLRECLRRGLRKGCRVFGEVEGDQRER